MKKNNIILLIIIITFLIFLITGILFWTDYGTYFFLDKVFFPLSLSDIIGNIYRLPITDTIESLSILFFGVSIFAKIYFVSILGCSVFLGYKIGIYLDNLGKKHQKKPFLNPLVGILFFLFNPFLYERMLTQPGVYGGIVVLGLGLIYLLEKKWIISFVLFGLSVCIIPHTIFMIGIIGISYVVFFYKNIQKYWKNILIGVVAFMLININWLIGGLSIGNNIQNFGEEDLIAFQTNGLGNLSPELTALLGYGFWIEEKSDYQYFLLPSNINSQWYLAGFFVLFISILGFIFIKKHKKKVFLDKKLQNGQLSLFLLSILFISLILGVGISSSIWGGFVGKIYDYIPYYIGLREPQKRIGLYIIILGIGFVYGVKIITKHIVDKKIFNKKQLNYIMPIIIFGILFLRVPTIINGFKGQLNIIDYPQGFYESKNVLSNSKLKTKTGLIFPRHSYMSCKWTNNRLFTNIFDRYYNPLNVVIADNIEMQGLYSHSNSRLQQQVENIIKNKDLNEIQDEIGYIIMLKKCADYESYDFLYNSNLKIIYSNEFVDVFSLK